MISCIISRICKLVKCAKIDIFLSNSNLEILQACAFTSQFRKVNQKKKISHYFFLPFITIFLKLDLQNHGENLFQSNY